MPEEGSGSSLSPHFAALQMFLIFATAASPLTKAAAFFGSIKTMCHRVPRVKCMLLRKAFPRVSLRLMRCSETSTICVWVPARLCLPRGGRIECPALGSASHSQVPTPLRSSLRSGIFWTLSAFPGVQGDVDIRYPKCRALGAKGGGTAASHAFMISWPRS